jgi:UDP-2,3-diacylglucosamine pyrophosphatase LpxH
MALPCALLWPDTHFPFEHKRAVRLVLKVADFLGSSLKEIYFLGDLADFYYISGHGKSHPSMKGHLKLECDSINAFLDHIDKRYPRTKKIFIEGNHEYRLERFVTETAPALYGMIDWQTEFGLRSGPYRQARPGWRVVPYGPRQKAKVMGSALWAKHEPLSSSAKASAARSMRNVVYGHIHRIEESHVVALDDDNYVNFSVGWLGDKKYDKVFGYVKNNHQWQLGFGLVYVCPKTKLFYHHKIHILEIKGKLSCVVNGKRFEG